MNEVAHCSHCSLLLPVKLLFFVEEEKGDLHLYLCESCNNKYIKKIREKLSSLESKEDLIKNREYLLEKIAYISRVIYELWRTADTYYEPEDIQNTCNEVYEYCKKKNIENEILFFDRYAKKEQ